MTSEILDGVTRSDGKSLLGNGLNIQTDDVIFWAETEEEMLEVLELLLRVAVSHNVAIHPDVQSVRSSSKRPYTAASK